MSEKVMSRLNQIVSLLCRTNKQGGATRREICSYIGLKKSPYTIELIERLVTDGWLESDWVHGATLPTKIYRPTTTALAHYGQSHDNR